MALIRGYEKRPENAGPFPIVANGGLMEGIRWTRHDSVESGWYDKGREVAPTMNLTLPLTPAEEAKLLAKARAAGTTPEQVVRQAIEPILASIPEQVPPVKTAKKSLLGIWSQYGPGPSEEEIDQNRGEMFSTFGRDDIA
jgi:hypothetical protein